MEKSQNDEDLVTGYLQGNENSWKLLVARYLKPLYNFAFQYVLDHADAEDITQETFVKAWKNLEKFDPKRNFKTWIFSIAKHSSIDFLKKKKNLPFSFFENKDGENSLITTVKDEAPFPDEILKRTDLAKLLNDAMKLLPVPYRVVLFLYHHDGFNFREIAEALEEPVDTIKSRHRRALSMLKKALGEEKNI